ncbi:MAG: magnesium chelatase subunit D [Burkholderiaceae bacterium]
MAVQRPAPGTAETLPAKDAAWAAALLAVDPVGIGGVVLRAPAGPAREQWLARLMALLPAGTPLRRMPAHIGDERLLGGLDLAATLRTGQPVVREGLLAEADGGVVVLAMAERIAPALAARLAAVLDARAVSLQRDGLSRVLPARLGLVALDEGEHDDECLPAALSERLAIRLQLPARAEPGDWPVVDVAAARARLAAVSAGDDILAALCEAAQALGIDSVRAPWLAWRVARAAAALNGHAEVCADDAALAARLVLGPRATVRPAEPPEGAESTPPAEAPPPTEPGDTAAADAAPADADAADDDEASEQTPDDRPLDDRLLEAAVGTLPAGLLTALAAGRPRRDTAHGAGRVGTGQRSCTRGRPIGAQRAELRAGARLDLLQTLRAAAPWQALRRREPRAAASAAVLLVRREDFHVKRFQQPRESTTIFAVDASGSQALHRLAEAKGAVELLLADCYVRRDRVALVAFRGRGAECLLPPTRSLVRAKRCLAELPGGGGTPLAAGIDSAQALADAVRRQGGEPLVVLLTDGRANVGRNGQGGRPQAQADAMASARALRQSGIGALLLDTAPQADAGTRALAEAMGARYLAMPHADAAALAGAVGPHHERLAHAGRHAGR